MKRLVRVTIKDIARQLDLSASTVSRALHNHPDIRPETKEKVLQLAKELDYQPDPIAQSLQKRRTNTIGVMVPEIKHDFFSSAISGIQDVAYNKGYTIMVCQSNENYDREVVNIRSLVANRVAGILISVSQTTQNSDHLKMVKRRGIPLVFFDRALDDVEASRVVVDDYNGAFQAVEYLIKAGYKRIAHVAGYQHVSIGYNRLNGYKSALLKYNYPYDEDLVVFGGFNESDGERAIKTLIKRKKFPDAIFAVNDPVAIGIFMQIRQLGLKMPDDIALVGFSDNSIATLIDPPLTTVMQQPYKIGNMAAKMLIEEIEANGVIEPKHHVLKTKLVIRGST